MSSSDPEPKIIQAKPVSSIQSLLGEGPLWTDKNSTLYWVDIDGESIHSLDSDTGETKSWSFEEPVCSVHETNGNFLLVGLAKRIVLIDFSGRITEEICPVETEIPENRCNDGKVDPAGRLWFGTMHCTGKPGQGSLYRLDGNRRPAKMLDNLSISNGLGWSRDGRTMFFIDSPTREIAAFDFDPKDSSISNRQVAVRIPESMGIPDGMSIDAEGNLWVAHWGDGAVRCWQPSEGKHLATVEIQDTFGTSCAFGGTKRNTLFITSATDRTAIEHSQGRLHQAQLNVSSGTTYSYSLRPEH